MLHNRKRMIGIAIAAGVVCIVVAVCLLANPARGIKSPAVQEYVPGAPGILGTIDTSEYERVSPDFAIGADQYGQAVFKEPYKAFDTMLELYAEGIALIQRENDLPPISRWEFSLYKKFGWQVTTGSAEAQEQAGLVTKFLDIYENSFIEEAPLVSDEVPATEDVPEETSPAETAADASLDPLEQAISKAILDQYVLDAADGLIHVESHALLANEGKSGAGKDAPIEEVTAYLLVMYHSYAAYQGELEQRGGSYIPTAITFSIDESGTYTLKEYWEPRDGSYYPKDIRAKFPEAIAEEVVMAEMGLSEELSEQCYQQALAYLNERGGLELRIEKLLDDVCSSPGTLASSPEDYIAAHDAEYQELLGYGEFSLRFCFTEFLKGGQTDLRGHVMAQICQDISAVWGEALVIDGPAPATGQAWFDALLSNAKSLQEQVSAEDLEKYYPVSWLLLQAV